MSFKDKCLEYFEIADFYEILEIPRDATPAQIKKAYHKASLLVHPDRVPEIQKIVATEKFKIISKIYSVLADENKRRLYDEADTFDEEGGTDTLAEWIETFRRLFKPITRESIDKHRKEYINSLTEERDIKKAYTHSKGNMNKMHDMIPFLDCANEERIIEIVRKLIDAGDLEEYDGFFNENTEKKKRRLRREKKNTLTKEEEDAMFDEHQEFRRDSEMEYAKYMADLEARYCQPKKKAIKSAKATKIAKNISNAKTKDTRRTTKGVSKTAKTGRVTKRR